MLTSRDLSIAKLFFKLTHDFRQSVVGHIELLKGKVLPISIPPLYMLIDPTMYLSNRPGEIVLNATPVKSSSTNTDTQSGKQSTALIADPLGKGRTTRLPAILARLAATPDFCSSLLRINAHICKLLQQFLSPRISNRSHFRSSHSSLLKNFNRLKASASRLTLCCILAEGYLLNLG